MRKVETILWVVLAVLVGVPLVAFIAAIIIGSGNEAGGFYAGAWVAAVYMGIMLFFLLLVPLAINVGLAWGLGKVHGVARQGIGKVNEGVARSEQLVDRGTRFTVQPDVWLHSRVSWLRGFFHGLRRPVHPQSQQD